ncbi:hypothetical protein Mtc_2480 [Methanocella conradii HZ254]|uniref:Uncharacterized protein n=1 Tax=Methanocella conradii (strain DSM 24694 / JCM 17849 / CGMCC 1.5162 / HZ254) TaxID=1041930 RepID=H8I7J5_METCZ|nr:hypothetical protein [Methanocella conradii]AFD01205.1 hypothetical protein Mtc_2480 [Methanocella conradii HZ254]
MAFTIRALSTALLILAVAALCGCSGPEKKITATVAPIVDEEATPTPLPTPSAQRPAVSLLDGKVIISGYRDGASGSFRLDSGVYIVTWESSGTYLSFSLTDASGNGSADLSNGAVSGKKLLIVDGDKVYPGNFTLIAASDSSWKAMIERADAISPASLPITMSCGEGEVGISSPFEAHAGDMWISYSFSRTAQGDGHVYIYNVNSGLSFYTRPLAEGAQAGESMAIVPDDGVYIAEVTIPPGASYGEVKISQK